MASLFDLLVDQPPSVIAPTVKFDGPCFDPALDQARLSGQVARIRDLMADGQWRTLNEIVSATHDPAASVSAQLRHLRKRRFGSHQIDKRRRGLETRGLWEYRMGKS